MRRRLLPGLVVVQLVLIAGTGAVTIVGLPLWGIADERAHTAYVDAVGEGRLPVLGEERTPPPLGRVGLPLKGLARDSYEAFQPPLYYLAAALPWKVASSGDAVTRGVRTLRVLDLLALAVTVALLWLLVRRVTVREGRDRALAVFAVVLAFVLWPGLIVRSVTVSNAALEMPLVAGAILTGWIAWTERSGRALVAFGALTGLGLLARLTVLPLLLALPVLAWRLRRTAPPAVLAALVLPPLLLAPWLAFNLHHFDALTASAVVREMQGSLFDPGGKGLALADLPRVDQRLLFGVLPEEWWFVLLDATRRALFKAILIVALVVPLLAALRSRRGLVFAAPLLAGLVLMQLATVVGAWDFAYPRYLYAFLPAFGVFAGLALPRRAAAPAAALATVVLTATWIYLGTVTPATF